MQVGFFSSPTKLFSPDCDCFLIGLQLVLDLCWVGDWITSLENACFVRFFSPLSKFTLHGWGSFLRVPTPLGLPLPDNPLVFGAGELCQGVGGSSLGCVLWALFSSHHSCMQIWTGFVAPSPTTPQGRDGLTQAGYFMIIQLLFCKPTWSVSSKTKDAAPDGCVQEGLKRERWEWQSLIFQTRHPTAKNLLDWCVFHWAT